MDVFEKTSLGDPEDWEKILPRTFSPLNLTDTNTPPLLNV